VKTESRVFGFKAFSSTITRANQTCGKKRPPF
jgi:hypothetical protein